MAAYLTSQLRSAREDSARKPRRAGSLAGCADRSRPARHNITRALAYFIGSIPNLSTSVRWRRLHLTDDVWDFIPNDAGGYFLTNSAWKSRSASVRPCSVRTTDFAL